MSSKPVLTCVQLQERIDNLQAELGKRKRAAAEERRCDEEDLRERAAVTKRALGFFTEEYNIAHFAHFAAKKTLEEAKEIVVYKRKIHEDALSALAAFTDRPTGA